MGQVGHTAAGCAGTVTCPCRLSTPRKHSWIDLPAHQGFDASAAAFDGAVTEVNCDVSDEINYGSNRLFDAYCGHALPIAAGPLQSNNAVVM
jgi:hypothetical protein